MTKRNPAKVKPKTRATDLHPRSSAPRKSESQPAPLTQPKSRRRLFEWAGLAAIAIIAVAVMIIRSAPPPIEPAFNVGSVRYCSGVRPQFTNTLGFNQTLALDTRASQVKGIALREIDTEGNILNSYQHPSWSSAGYLGPYIIDQHGDIYTAPIPFISILDNPPERANTIYRIHNQTGEMQPYVDLPVGGAITAQSVYGVLDLAYDCDTSMVYAASVLGSTYDRVAGRIFQIDPSNGQIRATLDGVDAFGLVVYNSAEGKRLYFGLARVPEVYSIALDENGGFVGDPRPEISLEGMGFHHDERAQSITFPDVDVMQVKTIQFDFNLVAPTETRQTIFEYVYDYDQNTWDLIGSLLVDE